MKEFWVQNNGTSDVHISDLGLKVPSKKTINIFKANPYLTEEKVNKSLQDGSLFRRLRDKKIKIIKKNTNLIPALLKKIKDCKNPIPFRKSKSSVIIEGDFDVSENGDSFEFADYGVEEIKK